MLRLQGTGRSKKIAARQPDGQVIKKVPDLLCARKHVIDEKGWCTLRNTKNVFCFVSSPTIYQQKQLRKKSAGWCHALRNAKALPDKPQILLPESDFLEEGMVHYKKGGKKRYDYFYFTLNDKSGVEYKGLHEFLDILPILCKHKLKGKIIVYYPNSGMPKRFRVKLSDVQKHNLRAYAGFIDIHWGLLSDKQMNAVMTECKFGLFPNIVDNSPRIISESLIRDIPVLVNNSIHGGWHYVNEHTGCLYTRENLSKSIQFMKSNKFSARDFYGAHYGFERSSRRLASFVNKLFGYDFSHMYFSNYWEYLERIK